MTERPRTMPAPARFGLTEERAERDLRAAGWWDTSGPVDGGEPVLVALSHSPDPDLALRGLDRLREADPAGWAAVDEAIRTDVGLRGRLCAVFGTSTALADYLVAWPNAWRRLSTGGRTPVAAYTDTLLAAVHVDGVPLTGADAVRALRPAYRGLLLEIAAADLGHLVEPSLPPPAYETVADELTELAEAALRAALAVSTAELGDGPECRLAVIAMGKCGGHELNYVSDVDVVFVGDGDMMRATRLASGMMRVAGAAAFEVDAALRPEGKAGALVRTLEGHTAYYQRWARTWEFQALLKARPVAGDAELGQAYLDVVMPLVWTAADRDGFVADVRAMRRRVEDHVPSELVDRELKLGRGGLRDVEFAVQLLQLVHGRSDEALRRSATVEALAALGSGGYVGRVDAAELTESYRFLRGIEHRLQLRHLRRTHLFPDEHQRDELHWLARAAGIRPGKAGSAGDTLLAEFRRQGVRVRRLHEKLFYRPLLESVARVPTEALRLTTGQAVDRLAALGYFAPDGALRHIKALTDGVSRRAAIQSTLLPVLLDLLADTSDPDGGLLAYRKLSEALATTPWYLRLLRDEGAVAERLAYLLGTSKLVPDLMIRAPEVLRMFAHTEELASRDPAVVAQSLRAAVSRHADVDQAVTTARSLRRHELLRVACADLLGLLPTQAVCAALSSVWVAVLDSTLDTVLRAKEPAQAKDPTSTKRSTAPAPAKPAEELALASRPGEPAPTNPAEAPAPANLAELAQEPALAEDSALAPPANPALPAANLAPAKLAVIGMGRLGGAELGYGSDADVLFVCEPNPGVSDADAVRWASSVAEELRKALGSPSQDPPLLVDADLRPEGRQGPLVRTLDSYRAYYAKWSEPWEAQALLRARPVAGDPDLGARFIAEINPVRYPAGGLNPPQIREIRRIKARVDSERLPRGADPSTHTKLGRGGLADVEWTVQLIQLRHAHETPALRTTSTLAGLAAAVAAGLLDAADADELRTAWLLATEARNATMLVRGKASDQLPTQARELAAVASAATGHTVTEPGEFLDDYRRTTRRARAVIERVFYE